MTPQVLIIADDLTGAADCGVVCACHGLDTTVLLGWSDEDAVNMQAREALDVLSIDADTRCLSQLQAGEVVEALIRRLDLALHDSEGTLLFKKLDSTLRGNVAAEIAAALKVRRATGPASGHVVALLAPATPRHGRTTVQGRQLIHGRLLEHSDAWQREQRAARSDMREVLLEAALRSTVVDLATVRGDARQLENAMLRMANDVDVLICDAETDADMLAVARGSMVLGKRTVWAGSAGLAWHLPSAAGISRRHEPAAHSVCTSGPTLFVVGSAAAESCEQARMLAASSNVVSFTIPHSVLLLGERAPAWQDYATLITAKLQLGDDVLVILDSRQRCSSELGSLLTRSLANMMRDCGSNAGALVATGGETARAILDAWGIRRLHVLGEVEPGLPFSVAEGWQRAIPILTKAGGFGNPEALLHCRSFLQTLERTAGLIEPKQFFAKGVVDMEKPIIAITMGDAAGVGPEIIIKSLAHPEVYEQCRPLVIGDAQRLVQAARITGSELQVRSLSVEQSDQAEFQPGIVDCVDLKLIPPDLPWGRLSTQAGEGAYQYLAVAARLALEGKVAAICTAPLNKEALQAAGHKFPGHTELLAHLTGTPEVSMMLSTPKMKVLHVTTHIGLIDAIAKIEPALVERTIARGHAALEKTGLLNPRIGVCGINPHAGENGLFGHGEEEEKIIPAIEACRLRGWNIEGPLPADTLFFRAQRGDFDLVIAMYHDQGHGPVKVLGLESGVNITIGLPVVRTSVDHGTAFDIAGTGVADERSLLEAIRQAVQLAPKSAESEFRPS